MTYAWIAVALATAIRLSAGARPWSAAAVAVLALLAVIFAWSGGRSGRRSTLAALFLLVVAAIDGASLWRVYDVGRNFRARAAEHLVHDVADLRRQIAELEAELDRKSVV